MKSEPKKTFTFINDCNLQEHIRTATRHIIYAAPSVSKAVAVAIWEITEMVPSISIRIVIDADADAVRLGFGDQDGLKLLCDKEMDVRHAPGLRIALLVVDDRAWVYAPTPEIVFEQPDSGKVNAVEVNVEFAKQVLFAIAPDVSVVRDEDILDEALIAVETVPEIGVEKVKAADIDEIAEELKDNPPQKFDSARKVRVYQGYLQFVELNFRGSRIGGYKIKIPPNFLSLRDADLRSRINSTCNLIQDKGRFSAQIQMLEFKVRDFRKEYIRPLGERFGSVLLRRRRDEFDRKYQEIEKEIGELRKIIVEDLVSEIENSRNKLVDLIVSGWRVDPPNELLSSNGSFDEKWAREYVSTTLQRHTPPAEELAGNMQLTCDYKDVTFEMMNNDEFSKAVTNRFPDEKFVKLYLEEGALAERRSGSNN